MLVGPSAEVMEQMGRKDAARAIAEKAGVAVVPSYDLEADASSFDYPVLVKAAAGGGGKGMRIVRSEGEYAEALAAAKREAASAFGDDTMLIEKYVESGRHIEVQVLADSHGNVVHLFERDCSTQRRHQKVLEEAPAPTITPGAARRGHLGSGRARQAGRLRERRHRRVPARQRNGAHLLPGDEHPPPGRAPGDRAGAPGVDLVELQLRVASGEELPLTQDDLRLDGHAIEARVYAEDSFGGFLPQAGTADAGALARPASRVDAALESGQVVSTSYDPMLGKVIAHGRDREDARRRLVAALDETAVLGFTTNVGFLRVLAASDEFRDATIDTAWLDHARGSRPGRRPGAHDRRVGAGDAGRRPRRPGSVPGRRLPAQRGAGTDAGGARPGRPGGPRPRPGRRRAGHPVLGRGPRRPPRGRRPPGPGGRERDRPTPSRSSSRGSGSSSSGPTPSPGPAPPSARAASPPRCRAPSSRSTSPRGMLSRKGSDSAYWRR